MNRLLGILLMVAVLYGVLMISDENARTLNNQETIAGRLGFYGILTIGVGVLIVSGGIDLSIGSVVGLGAVSFGLLLSGPMTERTAFLLGGLAPLGLAFTAGAWLQDRVRDDASGRPWLELLSHLSVLALSVLALAAMLLPLGWLICYVLLRLVFSLLGIGALSGTPTVVLSGLAALALSVVIGVWLWRRLRGVSGRPGRALITGLTLAVALQVLGWWGCYHLLFRLASIAAAIAPLLDWLRSLVEGLGVSPEWNPMPAGRCVFPILSALVVLWASGQIGLVHGLLVTRLRLQPFLVTLCGLFVYRGLARWASTSAVGLGVDAPEDFIAGVERVREFFVGNLIGVPQQLILLVLLSLLLGLFLHGTRHGRYLLAIGANEDAARYAGIATERYKVLAYFLCSLLAGLGGVLTMFESRSVNATNAGSLLELYAITGAVLGGCSLRGGEGSVAGMFLGAAVLPLLRQLCSFGGISNELEYAVIGLALLTGTVVDELLKRRAAGRTA